jgi:hypothetical protein
VFMGKRAAATHSIRTFQGILLQAAFYYNSDII